jgi:hypothetical protein
MPEQLVRAPVNEMRLSARGTVHGQIEMFAPVGPFFQRQLDKLTGRGTSENDVGHWHTIEWSLPEP